MYKANLGLRTAIKFLNPLIPLESLMKRIFMIKYIKLSGIIMLMPVVVLL